MTFNTASVGLIVLDVPVNPPGPCSETLVSVTEGETKRSAERSNDDADVVVAQDSGFSFVDEPS